jgi:hypothetical protein
MRVRSLGAAPPFEQLAAPPAQNLPRILGRGSPRPHSRGLIHKDASRLGDWKARDPARVRAQAGPRLSTTDLIREPDSARH